MVTVAEMAFLDGVPRELRRIADALQALAPASDLVEGAGIDPHVVKNAVDSLIATHETTGINLYNAPAWLALVREVYPAWDSDLRSH